MPEGGEGADGTAGSTTAERTRHRRRRVRQGGTGDVVQLMVRCWAAGFACRADMVRAVQDPGCSCRWTLPSARPSQDWDWQVVEAVSRVLSQSAALWHLSALTEDMNRRCDTPAREPALLLGPAVRASRAFAAPDSSAVAWSRFEREPPCQGQAACPAVVPGLLPHDASASVCGGRYQRIAKELPSSRDVAPKAAASAAAARLPFHWASVWRMLRRRSERSRQLNELRRLVFQRCVAWLAVLVARWSACCGCLRDALLWPPSSVMALLARSTSIEVLLQSSLLGLAEAPSSCWGSPHHFQVPGGRSARGLSRCAAAPLGRAAASGRRRVKRCRLHAQLLQRA
jgi:hypothetical protein